MMLVVGKQEIYTLSGYWEKYLIRIFKWFGHSLDHAHSCLMDFCVVELMHQRETILINICLEMCNYNHKRDHIPLWSPCMNSQLQSVRSVAVLEVDGLHTSWPSALLQRVNELHGLGGISKVSLLPGWIRLVHSVAHGIHWRSYAQHVFHQMETWYASTFQNWSKQSWQSWTAPHGIVDTWSESLN